MARLKNSVIDFTNRTIEQTSIEDYFTFDLKAVLTFVDEVDQTIFDWYLMRDDDKLERISLQLYNNPDYWDILMLINGKDALFDMPYNFDTVSKLGEELANRYAAKISNHLVLPQAHIDQMAAIYEQRYLEENEINRPLKIIKPARMQEFIRLAYQNGVFV